MPLSKMNSLKPQVNRQKQNTFKMENVTQRERLFGGKRKRDTFMVVDFHPITYHLVVKTKLFKPQFHCDF